MLLAFLLSVALIIVGYVILAVCVSLFGIKAPGVNQFIAGATSFFLFCGASHAHDFIHALNDDPITRSDWEGWHMLAIHIPQAISVYVAIWGLWNIRRWIHQIINENKRLRKYIETVAIPQALDKN